MIALLLVADAAIVIGDGEVDLALVALGDDAVAPRNDAVGVVGGAVVPVGIAVGARELGRKRETGKDDRGGETHAPSGAGADGGEFIPIGGRASRQ